MQALSRYSQKKGKDACTRKELRMKTLADVDVKGKIVLVRADFNVPLSGESITDDTRIKSTLPTLKKLEGAKQIILMSHLGKPKGKDPTLSLKPVAQRLQELLEQDVTFIEDCLGERGDSSIVLLENVRFYDEEKSKDDKVRESFAKKLTGKADLFVNDAFATSHRKQASVYDIAKILPCAAGMLLEKEVRSLEPFVTPKSPSIAVLGGAKIEDKLDLIARMAEKYDTLILGGAMVFTFFKAFGYETGKSLVNMEKIGDVKKLTEEYGDKILLPDRIVIAELKNNKKLQELSPDDFENVAEVKPHEIPATSIGLDVFSSKAASILEEAQTIYWNGPFGVFEVETFRKGTQLIATSIKKSEAAILCGGGDTLSALNILNVSLPVSTGGGASSTFILEGSLVALQPLNE